MKKLNIVPVTLVTANDIEVLPPNPSRKAVILSSDTTWVYWINFGGTAAANVGIRIPAGIAPVVLEWDTWGEVLQLALRARAVGGNIPCVITEIVGP